MKLKQAIKDTLLFLVLLCGGWIALVIVYAKYAQEMEKRFGDGY